METVEATHGYATVEGLRLHYVDFGGPGFPLVAVHGVTGHAWAWHDVARGLGDRARVIALDLRGHGDSQWSADHEYGTECHVRDLAGLIEHLDLERFDLAGYSWGALIAIQYAVERPEGISNLVCVDVEPSFDRGEDEVPPKSESYPSAADVERSVRAANPSAPDTMVEVMSACGVRPGEGGAFVTKHDPFFLKRWPFRSDDHWQRLSRLEVPTFFVHAEDSFVRGDVMANMAELAPDGSIVHLPATTHVVPVDNPQGLVEAIRDLG